MNSFTKFFHEMFNPHCERCMDEREVSRVCNSCETLKSEVIRLTNQNNELLKTILEPMKPQQIIQSTEQPEPIKSKVVPWNVRRQMIETEDRKKAAALMRDAPKPISELEKEVGIDVENNLTNSKS